MKTPKIGIGSVVQLKKSQAGGKYRQRTVVVGEIFDVKGGVILADYLNDYRCWNVEDLELYVKPKKLKPQRRSK